MLLDKARLNVNLVSRRNLLSSINIDFFTTTLQVSMNLIHPVPKLTGLYANGEHHRLHNKSINELFHPCAATTDLF